MYYRAATLKKFVYFLRKVDILTKFYFIIQHSCHGGRYTDYSDLSTFGYQFCDTTAICLDIGHSFGVFFSGTILFRSEVRKWPL